MEFSTKTIIGTQQDLDTISSYNKHCTTFCYYVTKHMLVCSENKRKKVQVQSNGLNMETIGTTETARIEVFYV